MKTLTLFLFIFLLPMQAFSQWWNPLAPRDFNDCIIKNMKDGMSETAVLALQRACIDKYPQKESKNKILEEDKINARYEKCPVKRFDRSHLIFSIDGRYDLKNQLFINNIKKFTYDGRTNSVDFQNMNDFGISALMLGFTKAKQCHQASKMYEYTVYCSHYLKGASNGVASKSFGTLSCDSLPLEAKAMGRCIIGFSPIYNQFDDSILDFLEKNRYCN